MNTKTLLSVSGIILCIQCNNATAERLQYEERISKEISIRRQEYLRSLQTITDDKSKTPSKLIESLNLKEEYETMTGSKNISILFINKEITWIKNKALTINGLNGNPIDSLKDKIRYSYSISPITENQQLSSKIIPIVLFETTQSGGQNLEVISFQLIDAPNLDFDERIYYKGFVPIYTPPTTEPSQEVGYLNANPFWISGQNDKVIPALTQNKIIRATIKVKNLQTGSIDEYDIELDTSYLVLLISQVLQENPKLQTVAPTFKLEED
ncbi:BB0158 famile outer surface lipoprotein [Borrelia persica]|uniref:BB0158 famile outer surface lipoprotein n=1 Tax=Borrelia persica TaxID=44448 RepID=UPI0004661AC1|nr:hypothetical protein [Borrelia persica]